MAGAVPTQVVEIVRPGRAVERKGELDLAGRAAASRDELLRPENRLIWTNDNLVALQTLLEERDPKTKDWRYRGKVDLVYIDPPFMVNNDFRADNAIDIELDEKAARPGAQGAIARRDHRLQGHLAAGTRQLPLDAAGAARAAEATPRADRQHLRPPRLARRSLRQGPDGRDVRVRELPQRDRLEAEFRAQRHVAGGHALRASHGFDPFLRGVATTRYFKPQFVPHDAEYVGRDYKHVDDPERQLSRWTTSSGPGGAVEGQPCVRVPRDVTRYWRYSRGTDGGAVQGRAHRLAARRGRDGPSYKRYLGRNGRGAPPERLDGLWRSSTIDPSELLGYPTQKPVALLERIISASCSPGRPCPRLLRGQRHDRGGRRATSGAGGSGSTTASTRFILRASG